jgi:hypothetical protein
MVTKTNGSELRLHGKYSIHMQPLVVEFESGGLSSMGAYLATTDLLTLDTEIAGIIPAPPGSVAVFGVRADAESELLGVIVPGSTEAGYTDEKWLEIFEDVIRQDEASDGA